MTDHLAYVRPGVSADGLVNSAERYNLLTDAARMARTSRDGFRADNAPVQLGENEILVKNDTGADRNRFDIVAFEDPVYLRGDNLYAFADRQQTLLSAIEPAWPDHFLSWGVLQEPCREGKIARVRIGGVAVALVNFADADATTGHKYATVKDATYGYLDSAPCGPARVLWRDTTAVSSTRYWCKLWLGGPMPSGFLARTPGGGLSAASGANFPYTPGSGSCDVAAWSGSTLVDAGWNCTVFNSVPDTIAASKLIQVKFDSVGRPWQDVEPCDA